MVKIFYQYWIPEIFRHPIGSTALKTGMILSRESQDRLRVTSRNHCWWTQLIVPPKILVKALWCKEGVCEHDPEMAVSLKWTEVKWKSVLWSATSLERGGTIWLVISIQFKHLHLWLHGGALVFMELEACIQKQHKSHPGDIFFREGVACFSMLTCSYDRSMALS